MPPLDLVGAWASMAIATIQGVADVNWVNVQQHQLSEADDYRVINFIAQFDQEVDISPENGALSLILAIRRAIERNSTIALTPRRAAYELSIVYTRGDGSETTRQVPRDPEEHRRGGYEALTRWENLTPENMLRALYLAVQSNELLRITDIAVNVEIRFDKHHVVYGDGLCGWKALQAGLIKLRTGIPVNAARRQSKVFYKEAVQLRNAFDTLAPLQVPDDLTT
jgi:hypothetical protein